MCLGKTEDSLSSSHITQKVKMRWYTFFLLEKENGRSHDSEGEDELVCFSLLGKENEKNYYTESNDELGYLLPCNRRKIGEITV